MTAPSLLLIYAASILLVWLTALALDLPLLFAAGFLCAASVYVYKHAGACNPRRGFGYVNAMTLLRLMLCAGLAAIWTWADERAFGWRRWAGPR